MVVIRPQKESYLLPPGLLEESFDADTPAGRANLLAILVSVVGSVNREEEGIADLILVLSGPVTYFYRPGGGIPWEEIREISVHPLNRKNIGFRNGTQGSLPLTPRLLAALVQELDRAGFSTVTGPSSVTVAELGGTRITIYNPVEIGYSGSFWDILDPATSIYLGSPGSMAWIAGIIAFFPDKRTTLASQFINDAKAIAGSGDPRGACRPLAGAAQVLGRIRLRGEIVVACGKGRFGASAFGRFLAETETARDTIDALWRYHAGEQEKHIFAVPLEPVTITLREQEAGEFTALCQDLGIVCIAAKKGELAAISLDKHDLGKRAGEIGTGKLPRFSLFFEEVSPAGRDPDLLIRVRDGDGSLRYYDLRDA